MYTNQQYDVPYYHQFYRTASDTQLLDDIQKAINAEKIDLCVRIHICGEKSNLCVRIQTYV